MKATPALRIRLLGELDMRLDGLPLPPLESARGESLPAWLLLHRDAPQARQRLAFLLWPDSTEPQARTNLRHVLHNLRRALPDLDRFLQVTPRTLQWRPPAGRARGARRRGRRRGRAQHRGPAGVVPGRRGGLRGASRRPGRPTEGAAGVRTAYGRRLDRLVALKDRHDPGNLFRMNANIPPSRDAGAATPPG